VLAKKTHVPLRHDEQLSALIGDIYDAALDELTVATMARDGSWGVATAGSQGQAIAAAIRDCQAMAAAPSDCGSQFVTTRGGWVIANLCRDHKISALGTAAPRLTPCSN
jgi:hypothetical protein